MHCRYRSYTASVIGWLMNMEELVQWELAGEAEELGEIPSVPFYPRQSPHEDGGSNRERQGRKTTTLWGITQLSFLLFLLKINEEDCDGLYK